ncbi:phytoene/squalene synthase family protein [Nannocystis bainbridge]|uniref:Phytoene/squalene synthase family protein n=1 Tax=Nannocystis bainbridge TaxID=2995303 RepID=A0ABT5DUD0_9BACT|nr:phytoene/squalene synthase family protein [Nannocystis bainbridge]MDC0717254.1 phytoene/squalene synthase family protein [Nannocystis bainbridge]
MSYDRARVVAESRATLARHARTFDLAGWFLPAERLDEAAVVYAFCRLVDDVVDEAQAPGEGLADVGAIEAELSGAAPARPLVACYRDLLAGWGVPLRVAHELIAGVRADAGPVALPDDAALLRYCYQVAGTVGLMMCGVIGARDPQATPFALDLGIAMQLTNIARDVAEDAGRGRVYLPETRLDFAGTSPAALLDGTAGREAVASVVLDVLALAERYYASADAGLRFIPWRTRLAIVVASRVYRAIGLRLRRHGGDALAGRTVVPALEKVVWTGAALLAFVRGALRPQGEAHDPGLHRLIADLPGTDAGARTPARASRGGRVLQLVREVF